VRVIIGDGSLGYPEAAPYEAIVVTDRKSVVSQCLREQLAEYGRMVIPVTEGFNEDLRLVERVTPTGSDPDSCFRELSILACTFVPLIGKEGYPP